MLSHLLFWIALPSVWIGWGQALLNYCVLTWIQGVYLAFVFLPSHLGRKTEADTMALPALLRQVVITRNLSGSMLLTHLCMGLNSHIEHYLFGTLPATRISEARKTTRLLCQRYGVPYSECSVLEALGEVQRYNRQIASIAQHARFLRRGLVQVPRLLWSGKK